LPFMNSTTSLVSMSFLMRLETDASAMEKLLHLPSGMYSRRR